ncbi:hypothetical protein IWQ60_003665 [Tieghemiomyces parasiticus]|uniref:Uncharacterized protein n=1 Tax=Tieghemiomyces parasiticus TaxID=78921 RepID=A0A9W8DZU4_9FUNG|nr:hypothetical protein IWQ60_003665 [Tieghemiomyces parasiticus]
MKGTLGRSTNKPSPPPYQQLVASSHSPLTRSINSITTAAEPDSVSEVESKHIRTTTAALPTEHLPNIGECSCTDAASRLVNPATDQLNAEGPPPPYSE